MTNLAAVKHGLATYDPDVVQGTVLDRDEIDRQIELYRTLDASRRREIVGLQPARAEVILAGACIVRTILDLLDVEAVKVSDHGLRHGVLLAHFGASPDVRSGLRYGASPLRLPTTRPGVVPDHPCTPHAGPMPSTPGTDTTAVTPPGSDRAGVARDEVAGVEADEVAQRLGVDPARGLSAARGREPAADARAQRAGGGQEGVRASRRSSASTRTSCRSCCWSRRS